MTDHSEYLIDDPIAGTILEVPPGGLPEDHPLAGSYLDVPPDRTEPDGDVGNLDGNGQAHFCLILPAGEGEICGGCRKEWPCDDAVRLAAFELPDVV